MSALSAFTPPPPPPRLLHEGERFVCVCVGRRCRQAARECNGVWLGRLPARPTLYHTLVLVCGRASHRPSQGRIPDDWGDLPDHWRLRPGRWVWPHLTDNQLAYTHNKPGYTPGSAGAWLAASNFSKIYHYLVSALSALTPLFFAQKEQELVEVQCATTSYYERALLDTLPLRAPRWHPSAGLWYGGLGARWWRFGRGGV